MSLQEKRQITISEAISLSGGSSLSAPWSIEAFLKKLLYVIEINCVL